jgi:4a-hydroxytetrahydrobiopterin dehydratase
MSSSLEDLQTRHCMPLRGAEHALSVSEVQGLRALLADWTLSDDGKTISRDYRFKDFHRTMAFVNAVAFIAHREDHHPDMEIGYGHCHVRYTTHDVGGLSINDFICAARVDLLSRDANA